MMPATKLEELHSFKLKARGLPDKGVREAIPNPRYKSAHHCFDCAKKATGNHKIQCNGCHWIICSCGSCGCIYYQTKKGQRKIRNSR